MRGRVIRRVIQGCSVQAGGIFKAERIAAVLEVIDEMASLFDSESEASVLDRADTVVDVTIGCASAARARGPARPLLPAAAPVRLQLSLLSARPAPSF